MPDDPPQLQYQKSEERLPHDDESTHSPYRSKTFRGMNPFQSSTKRSSSVRLLDSSSKANTRHKLSPKTNIFDIPEDPKRPPTVHFSEQKNMIQSPR